MEVGERLQDKVRLCSVLNIDDTGRATRSVPLYCAPMTPEPQG